MLKNEDVLDEEPSWVDQEIEPSNKKIHGSIKIPRLLIDPQL